MTVSPEEIEWAAKAYYGTPQRSLDFIASVIGEPPKKTFALIKAHRAMPKMPHECPSAAREAAERLFAPRPPKVATAPAQPYVSKLDRFRVFDEDGEFMDRPQMPSDADARQAEIVSARRRKRCLRRRFARYWDMIWFQRSRGMCGRTLRQIYGADVLIWAAGGGIDPDIS